VFIIVCAMCILLFDLSFVAFPSVPWYCWPGLLTCKNRLPYNLYCVGGDIKQCTIQSNPVTILHKTQVIAIIDCMQGAWLHTSLFS